MEALKNTPWYQVIILLVIGLFFLIKALRSDEGLTYNAMKGIGVVVLTFFFVLMILIAKLSGV